VLRDLALFPDFKISRLTKTKQYETLPEIKIILDDRDSQFFYLKVPFNFFKLHKLVEAGFVKLNDFLNSWSSTLDHFIILQVYNFPEFIHWCARRYVASFRSFVDKNGTWVFDVRAQSIS